MSLHRWRWIVYLLVALIGGSVVWFVAREGSRSPEMREPGQVVTETNTQELRAQPMSPGDATSAKSAREQRLQQVIQKLIDEERSIASDATDEEVARELREQQLRRIVQKLIDDGVIPPVALAPSEESAASQPTSQPENLSRSAEEEQAKQILEEEGPLAVAQYLANRHRYDELTVDYARQAVSESPNSVEALLMLGMVLRDREEQAVVYRRVLELEPDSVDALVRLGGMLAQFQPWESIGYSERLIAVASATGHEYLRPGYFHLGLAYERLGKYEEAIEAYRTSQDWQAETRIQRIQSGNPIFPPLDTTAPPEEEDTSQREDSNEASSASTSVRNDAQEDIPRPMPQPVQTDITQTPVRESESGEPGDDRGWYQRLAEEKPEIVSQAHYELAKESMKEGRLEEAAEDLHRAIELNPKHTDSYRELANVYERMEEYERAATVYQQALKQFPEDERLRRDWETFRDKHLREEALKRPEPEKQK